MELQLIRDIDAAGILGCSRATLWKMVKLGTVPQPIRIGSLTRWRKSDIADLIARASDEKPAVRKRTRCAA